MRRRDFIIVSRWRTGLAWPIAARAQQPDSRYVGALEKAKRDYEKISHPSEADRSNYITRLVRLREKAADAKTDEWQAIDAEIKQHPAPNDSDSKTLSICASVNGNRPGTITCTGPTAPGRCCRLKRVSPTGRWRIEGNQCFDTAATDPPLTSQYTIILITKKDFVFTDQTIVFYETRLK